jgi:4-hydroxy-3-polyprenylbenzoate decarboxylase
MTGASGIQYGLRLLDCLVKAGHEIHLMLSTPARVVIGMETDLSLPSRNAEAQRFLTKELNAEPDQIRLFGEQEWTAPAASGSARTAGMVICPCTSGTLGGVAAGTCRNLIERAAEVMLKEQRKLIIVLRETPLSVIQLENMLKLARAGACILPANPAFYHRPEKLEDIIDFIVARILDQLGIKQEIMPPWGQ